MSGPFGSTLKSDSYLQNGIPFIRIENIRGGFNINTFNMVYISEQDNSKIRNSQLFVDDIILSKVGNSIGYFARVDDTIGSCNISENNIGIKVKHHSSNEKSYILTFLNCKFAKTLVLRRTSGNAQPKLNVSDLCFIPIPEFTDIFYSKIRENVLLSQNKLCEANSIYKSAEAILNNYLDISDYPRNSFKVKALSKSFMSSGRLDAEYYQPKYDYLKDIISRYPNKPLKELANVNTGEFVEEKFYGDNGIDYIRGADITNPVVDNNNAVKVNININDLKTISYGELAFAMIGSVGNVSIYKSSTVGLVSNNVGTISPFEKNLSNYILLFLTSRIGQMYFEKFQTRTAQPKIKKEDVENFIIPLLGDEAIKSISDKLEESFHLREESKHLLDNATKAVEMAIETDEAVALLWLDSQS